MITGFDPFGGETTNPSWEAVRKLPDSVGDFMLCKLEIPTIYGLAAEKVLETAKKYALPGDISRFYPFFQDLELLTPRWETLLNRKSAATKCREELGYLMKYLICRYWLQAVSDGELTVWVKFMVIACLLVNALGGDMVATAQLFSKEIENDPDNLDAILDAVYAEPPFTDSNLLGLLLGN